MKNEIWKTAHGTEGRNEVSNAGRVRKSEDKYILSQTIVKDTPMVSLRQSNGRYHPRSVLRLMLATFRRPPKPGEICIHIDGFMDNNSLDNLAWVPKTYVHPLRNRRKRWTSFERYSKQVTADQRVLTDEQVNYVRKHKDRAYKYKKALADKLGVSVSVVCAVADGHKYSDR